MQYLIYLIDNVVRPYAKPYRHYMYLPTYTYTKPTPTPTSYTSTLHSPAPGPPLTHPSHSDERSRPLHEPDESEVVQTVSINPVFLVLYHAIVVPSLQCLSTSYNTTDCGHPALPKQPDQH
jgi:hypothetical protein